MSRKLADEIKKMNLAMPQTLARQIDEWRRQQMDYPNVSEAVRRLIEHGLETKSGRKARKHRDEHTTA
jgi:Arc/MetJ-type ribon-helix-helix transcriptional regulator